MLKNSLLIWQEFLHQIIKIIKNKHISSNRLTTISMGNKQRKYPRRDLKNKNFGKLQVIDFIDYIEDSKGRRHDYWSCICKCGNKTQLRGNVLITGGVKSCGCLLKEYYNYCKGRKGHRALPSGQAAFNDIYSRYKYRAEKVLKVEFKLTKEQFKDLTQNSCSYCNNPPSLIYTGRSKNGKKQYNGSYTYNGIDRIDSDLGYTLTNVTTACKICNKAKLDLSKKEFIEWITRLVKFHTTPK